MLFVKKHSYVQFKMKDFALSKKIQKIINLIDELEIDNAQDLGPHNLILNGKKLFLIDQNDKLDDVNTKEKLKDFLKQSGLL